MTPVSIKIQAGLTNMRPLKSLAINSIVCSCMPWSEVLDLWCLCNHLHHQKYQAILPTDGHPYLASLKSNAVLPIGFQGVIMTIGRSLKRSKMTPTNSLTMTLPTFHSSSSVNSAISTAAMTPPQPKVSSWRNHGEVWSEQSSLLRSHMLTSPSSSQGFQYLKLIYYQ